MKKKRKFQLAVKGRYVGAVTSTTLRGAKLKYLRKLKQFRER